MADKTTPTTQSTTPQGSTASTRRTVLRTAGWATPVVAVAAAAPAVAASSIRVSGTQRAVRYSSRIVRSTGSVINDTAVDQLVTLTWTWTVSSGGTIEFGSTRAEASDSPWKIVFRDFVPDTQEKSYRLVVTRLVKPGETLGFPITDIYLTSVSVIGTVTAELSVGTPAYVVQPAPVDWPAFTVTIG